MAVHLVLNGKTKTTLGLSSLSPSSLPKLQDAHKCMSVKLGEYEHSQLLLTHKTVGSSIPVFQCVLPKITFVGSVFTL